MHHHSPVLCVKLILEKKLLTRFNSMKKNYYVQGKGLFFSRLKKFLLVMKLTIGIIAFFVFQATAAISQNTVATIHANQLDLDRFFSEIEKQTSVKFLYRYENIAGKQVSMNVENAAVDDILDVALRDQGLSYSRMGNNLIVISLIESMQSKKISGTVTDESGLPLPGVSIAIKGTSLGTVSDMDGNFNLAVSGDQKVLVFSFIGYALQEITIGTQTVLHIVMKEEEQAIDEVVVTAFGIERNKRNLTYTTQKVDVEALTTVKNISLGNALAGKLAGVSVVTAEGAGGVGSGSRIVIRGERSISGGNTPLIIVDGVPSNVGLDAINPDDVESINVLKGPSASALYGSVAANGVIIVTTKKGKAGEVKVEVNSSTSFDAPYLYPEFQNVYGQGVGGDYIASLEYYSWGSKMQGQTVTSWTGEEIKFNPQPDNVKDLFRAGYNFTNSLSYSTGNQKSSTYFSYTNITAGGVLPDNKMQRHNFNLRLNYELIKNLKMDFVITWLKNQSENAPVTGDDLFSPMWQLVKMPRSIRTADIEAASYYNESGSLKQLTWAPGSTGVINPYWSLYGRDAEENGSNINTVVSLKYNFTPWLYLQLRGRMANNRSDEEEKLYWDTQYINSGRGRYTRTYKKSQALNGDVLLGIDKDLTKDWHLSVNLGAEIKDNQSAELESGTGELVLENKFYLENGATVGTKDSQDHRQTQAVYGTAQLGFRNYLFLDLTARNDWSSTLPSPYDYFYPSVGLTGIISDMVRLPEVISFAKIRGSYAEVGNGAGFAQIFQTYSRSLNGSQGLVKPGSTKVPAQLIPEKTKSWEAGAEIRVLENRLGIDFTWYKANTYNQLVNVTSPPTSGFSRANINCGNIQNKGIEIMLSAVPLQTPDLKWEVNMNFTRNWSKVIELTNTLDEYEIASPNLSIGDSWIIVGKPYGEILSKGFERNEAGQIIVDDLGMPKITTESKTYLGNYHYDWRSGLTSNLRYKSWNFYFLIDLNYGGVRQSATEAQMMLSGTSKATLEGRDGFIYPGVREVLDGDGNVTGYVDNDIEITAEEYGKAIGGRASNGCGEAFNHKATNSRLRELSIGYTLPVRSSVIKNITVSAVGRNLFYIYNACNWFDPDVSYDLDKNGQGSESAFLPGTRNIGFNIKLTL
jgi:TonB-linked SusC/RagA family outer membrane protein